MESFDGLAVGSIALLRFVDPSAGAAGRRTPNVAGLVFSLYRCERKNTPAVVRPASVKRRDVLKPVAAGGLALAGWKSYDQFLASGADPDAPERVPIRIEEFGLVNDQDRSYKLAVTIRFEGKIVHRDTHSLAPRGSFENVARIDDLPDRKGRYHFAVEDDAGRRREFTPTTDDDLGCVRSITFLLPRSGGFGAFFPYPCRESSTTAAREH